MEMIRLMQVGRGAASVQALIVPSRLEDYWDTTEGQVQAF